MSAVRGGTRSIYFEEVEGIVSRKNNVNTDHYKTAGRGRPGEVALADERKHSYAHAAAARASAEVVLPGARAGQASQTRAASLRRRRRLSRLRGLSAKRLSERRRRLRQAGLG